MITYDIPIFNTICIGGGGIKGFSALGCLQFLSDQSRLRNVKKYIGVSVGSIISYLMAIGFTPIEVTILVIQKEIIRRMGEAFCVLDIINKGGSMDFYILHDFLEKLTIEKIGHVLTLRQLYDEFGKILVCGAYNHTLRCSEYFDWRTQPDMPCLTAVRMSSNLPFLFYPYVYNGYMYFDGGILDNIPLCQIDRGDVCLAISLSEKPQRGGVIGHPGKPYSSNAQGVSPLSTSGRGVYRGTKAPFEFIVLLFDILFVPISILHEVSVRNAQFKPDRHIHIRTKLPLIDWNITTREQFDCFSLGYETARKHFWKMPIVPYSRGENPPF